MAVSHKDDDSEVETDAAPVHCDVAIVAFVGDVGGVHLEHKRQVSPQFSGSKRTFHTVPYSTTLLWSRAVLLPRAIVLSRSATWGERRKHGSCSESLFL